MSYESIWQYQGRAQPTEFSPGTRPTAFFPLFLPLVPWLILGSFDAPPFPNSAALPTVEPPIIEALPCVESGSYDCPWTIDLAQPRVEATYLEYPPDEQLGSHDQPLTTDLAQPTVEPGFQDVLPSEQLGAFETPLTTDLAQPFFGGWMADLLPDEILGSSEYPLVDIQAPVNLTPFRPSEILEALPDQQLGSFDSPFLVESDAWTSGRMDPDPAWVEPEIAGSYDEARDDSGASTSWLLAKVDPDLGAMPEEILGSAERPIFEPAEVVYLNPFRAIEWLPETPADLIGSWDAPQAESFGPLPSAGAIGAEIPSEAPGEILGAYDAPWEDSNAYLSWLAWEPAPGALPEELLGSYELPLPEEHGAPIASSELPETPPEEILGWYWRPDRAPDVPLTPWATEEHRLPPTYETLGSFDAPFLEGEWVSSAGFLERNGNLIRRRFRNFVAVPLSLPTQYDNAPFAQPDTATWCRLEVDVGRLEQRSFGSGNVYRKFGTIRATLRGQVEDGDGAMNAIADGIVAAFRGVTADEITYLVPKIVRRARVGGWWEQEITIEFFDEIEVALPPKDTGAVTGLEDILAVARTRFRDLVALPQGLSTCYPNAPYSGPPDDAAWAMVNVVFGDSDPAELGSTKTYRTLGVFMVKLFVPAESGDAYLRRLADAVVENFRAVRDRGVLFRVPSAGEAREEGPWWTVNIECPFLADLRAT